MAVKKIRKIKGNRLAGILMPVSALPSQEGIGTMGKGAYAFVDWLEKAGMRLWQVLPLLPTGFGDSPYQSYASNALNFYFIDFNLLQEEGLLTEEEWNSVCWADDERLVDYGKLFERKAEILRKAFARFDKTEKAWQDFLKNGDYEDFSVFMAIKRHFNNAPWDRWEDEGLKNCRKASVASFAKKHREEIEFWQFTQFVFLRQWTALKKYANDKGILIMGDMPIYVAYDSVETWKYRKDLFMLGEDGKPSLRAGVPPDAFSKDGQLWGNPVYNWKKMKADGYKWWHKRIYDALEIFDCVRIDHFRGFDRFFVIDEGEETARNGRWLQGPSSDLFKGMLKENIVAEDLGVMDDGVRKMMKETGYPGMKVMMFGFDCEDSEHHPSNYKRNAVAYTGTHDNQTLRGYIESMDEAARRDFYERLEKTALDMDVAFITESMETLCESAIEILFASKANLVVVPMQDVLAFGDESRMNAPSTVSGKNWTFRFTYGDLRNRKASWLKQLTITYDR
ncbi:MAG: 4-alpha-glucanotransferase [Clostridia bacterium]|nr:4-alpha-glucanotransferase [Clostridia bacterium]